jgi:hypothetical protein
MAGLLHRHGDAVPAELVIESGCRQCPPPAMRGG